VRDIRGDLTRARQTLTAERVTSGKGPEKFDDFWMGI
jgi:hypothetical protein